MPIIGSFADASASITDGSIENVDLQNSSLTLGGVTISLGQNVSTPGLNLSNANSYPTSSLSGSITNAQLAGSIANSKLANAFVSFGGVSLNLGQSDATPSFNLQDATGYSASNLTGTYPDLFSSTTRYNLGLIDGNNGDNYDKIRVWNSSNYTMGMNSAMTFGWLNDYAMTFTMNTDSDRGFIWRDVGDAKSDGAMSLTTAGNLCVKNVVAVGGQTTRYLSNVTGQYGSIQVNGGGVNNWQGYSIDARAVFMHNGSTTTGIYNDVDNEWLFRGVHNAGTYMYYNGSAVIETSSTSSATTNGTHNATNFNTTSDSRLKENIEVVKDSISILKEINGVKFTWKETKASDIGVIAQEVEKVLPELVSENEEPKRVNYNGIIGVLVEAIKELTIRVEKLEGK